MSKIGKTPINVPAGVEVEVGQPKSEGVFEVRIKGSKGELHRDIGNDFVVEHQEDKLIVKPKDSKKFKRAEWGLYRALVNNLVVGVSEGFEKKLEIEGVGFKANVEGNKIVLNVGFSHPVELTIPEGINVTVEKNVITVSGIDKEKVGQVAANIRKVKPPEPYKGKGIRYQNEVVRRKAGKKAVGTVGA
jgi:large subunit ribosomal protein L6